MYNCFRGSDAGDLSERLSSVHEPSIFVNNIQLRGPSAFFLVSCRWLCPSGYTHKNLERLLRLDRVYKLFRGSDWGLMFHCKWPMNGDL